MILAITRRTRAVLYYTRRALSTSISRAPAAPCHEGWCPGTRSTPSESAAGSHSYAAETVSGRCHAPLHVGPIVCRQTVGEPTSRILSGLFGRTGRRATVLHMGCLLDCCDREPPSTPREERSHLVPATRREESSRVYPATSCKENSPATLCGQEPRLERELTQDELVKVCE